MSNKNLDLGFNYNAMVNKGKGNRPFKFERLKEGVQFYRILSLLGPERSLSRTFATHWIQNGEKKMQIECTLYTDGGCALCDEHKNVELKLKRAEESGAPADVVAELKERENALRVNRTVYFNALNSNNELVVLQLTKTVKDLLEKKIQEAVEVKGFDPTSMKSGVWFEFKKLGKGRDSVTVDFKRISMEVDGDIVEKLDRSPIAEDLASRLLDVAPNIHSHEAMWIRQYSAKEVRDFINGTPLPERQLAKSEPKESQNASPAQSSSTITLSASASVQASPVPTATSATSQSVAPKVSVDHAAEAARLRALANKT